MLRSCCSQYIHHFTATSYDTRQNLNEYLKNFSSRNDGGSGYAGKLSEDAFSAAGGFGAQKL